MKTSGQNQINNISTNPKIQNAVELLNTILTNGEANGVSDIIFKPRHDKGETSFAYGNTKFFCKITEKNELAFSYFSEDEEDPFGEQVIPKEKINFIFSKLQKRITEQSNLEQGSISEEYKRYQEFSRAYGEKRGDNYTIQADSNWNMYKLDKERIHFSDTHKIHISINRNIVDMAKAFDVIVPILTKYRICEFKILKEAAMDITGNPDGKEITVYIQKHLKDLSESDPKFWQETIIPEIVKGLHDNGVKHGKPSLGDIPLEGGGGYIYFRTPHNIVDKYVTAATFNHCGFTACEAATIGDDPFLELKMPSNPEKPTHVYENIEISGRIPSQKQIELIHNSYLRDLTKLIPSYAGLCPTLPIYNVCIGSVEPGYLQPGLAYTMTRALFPNIDCNQKMSKFFDYKLSEDFLKDALAESAKRTAQILQSLNINLETEKELELQCARKGTSESLKVDVLQVGNIMPIVYHKWYVHFVGHCKRNNIENDKDIQAQFDENPFITEEAREKFIQEVVKCSLRDRSKTTITELFPKYINGMSEQEVSRIVSKVGRKVDKNETQALPVKVSEDENLSSQGTKLNKEIKSPSNALPTDSGEDKNKSSQFTMMNLISLIAFLTLIIGSLFSMRKLSTSLTINDIKPVIDHSKLPPVNIPKGPSDGIVVR